MIRLILAFLLLFSVNASAWNPAIIAGNATGGAPGGDCPSGTYLFAYNGDHSSGATYACFTSGGSSKNDVTAGSPTADSVTSSYVEYNASDENIGWAVSGDDGLNDQEGTIYFSVYFVDDGGIGTNVLTESFADADNYIKLVTVAGQIIGFIEIATANYSTYGSTLSVDTWYRIGLAWKAGEAGNDFSISGVALGSAHSWADDDEDMPTTAWTPNDITIGEMDSQLSGTSAVDDTVRIKDFVVVSTYKGTDIWEQ